MRTSGCDALTHPALRAGSPLSRTAQGCPGKNLAATKGRNSPANFVLAGLDPWAFSPRTSIRGHPRLGAVDTKAWMRGSSPRKTTLTRSHGVLHKSSLQENFPRTGLSQCGRGAEGARSQAPLPHAGEGGPSPWAGWVRVCDREETPAW